MYLLTVPILLDPIPVPASQDTQGMEDLVKVGVFSLLKQSPVSQHLLFPIISCFPSIFRFPTISCFPIS